MKMKNKTKGIFYVIAFLLFVGLMYYGVQRYAVTGGEKEGGFIGVPAFGFLRCQESDTTISYPASGFQKFSDITIRCNQFGTLVQGCDVTIKAPAKSEVSGITAKDAGIFYMKCTDGVYCDASKVSQSIIVRRNWFWGDEGTKEVTVHLQKNEYLQMQYGEGFVTLIYTFGAKTLEKGSYKVYYRPFFINKYDIFSSSSFATVPNTTDCNYNAPFLEKNNIIEYVKGDGKLQAQYDSLTPAQKADLVSIRDPSKSVAYLSKIVAIVPPAYYHFSGDKSWYCTDKKIYNVETVKTDDGYVYRIADVASNKVLKEVPCCDSGDVPVGYYCKNFTIQKLSVSEGQECSALKQCPIVGYQSIPGKEVVYQECVSNKCVIKNFTVECNYDSECSGGSCQVDKTNPKNNKCIYSQAPVQSCGNGACEASFGETVDSCPKDCYSTSTKKSWLGDDAITILLMILGFVAIIVFMILLKKKMVSESGGKKKLLW